MQAVRSVASSGKFYRLPPDKENTVATGLSWNLLTLKGSNILDDHHLCDLYSNFASTVLVHTWKILQFKCLKSSLQRFQLMQIVFVLKKVRKKLFCNYFENFWSQSDSLHKLTGVILKNLV